MASLNEIKKRIKIIESTSKITNAMKLVSSAKLKKQKELFLNESVYYKKFYDLFTYIKSNSDSDILSLKKNEEGKTIWLAFFSSMGLCGSFNLNIVKELQKHIDSKDEIWLIGKKGKNLIKSKGIEAEISLDLELDDKDINFDLFHIIAENLLEKYKNNYNVKSIKVIYSKFVNSLSFMPSVFSLLPLDQAIEKPRLDKPNNGGDFVIQPNANDVFESILIDYLATCIHGAIVESKVCENASRRNAMDSATKNANELIKNYKLEFNRKRQSDITQEITEIVSGAKGE